MRISCLNKDYDDDNDDDDDESNNQLYLIKIKTLDSVTMKS